MAPGAFARERSHVHEALFYDTDAELLRVVVPFLEQGLAADEPTVVVLNDQAAELLHAAVDSPHLVFLSSRDRRPDPATAIAHCRELIKEHVAGGAHRVRVLGEVPHPGHGAPWEWWARYEAAVNHAYAEFPLWNVCPYDLRITPPAVVEDVTRTHPWLTAENGSSVENPRFEDPRQFLLRRPGVADPMETACTPRFDLLDPSPAQARRAVRACDDLLAAKALDIDDVVMCVNEALTNALLHGRSPVRVRLWSSVERIVVSVSDGGEGPGDPFVGLLPGTHHEGAEGQSAGLGLWMAHQMCSHLTYDRGEGGFTIRMVFDGPGVGW
jgi:anti-sigma regulatory factor (Ser/Thr protein kinase)